MSGVVSSSNSLVGSTEGDFVGAVTLANGILSSPVIALSNGNYVVSTLNWNNGALTYAGAVTWGNGVSGVSGVVSSSNSLVGSKQNDKVGSGGAVAVGNGNYVVVSPNWKNAAGAVTWGSGVSGVSGTISSGNSLVGSNTNDQVGLGGVTALSSGNMQ